MSSGPAVPPVLDPSRGAARRFYELTDDALVTLDTELAVLEANPAAERLLGGAAASFRNALHEEDRATALIVLEAARLAGAPAAFEARTPHDPDRWIEWRILPGDAGTAMLHVIGRDATIRRVHTREIETARDSTRQTTRLRTAFLDNLSHEIRTPLNVILGYVAVVEEEIGAAGVEPPAHILDGIRRASERLVGTIDAILDLAKVEAGIYVFRPVPLSLAKIVEARAGVYRPAALGKGLELRFENRAGEPSIEFDARAVDTEACSTMRSSSPIGAGSRSSCCATPRVIWSSR
jgi:signal transduction histidine kinase